MSVGRREYQPGHMLSSHGQGSEACKHMYTVLQSVLCIWDLLQHCHRYTEKEWTRQVSYPMREGPHWPRCLSHRLTKSYFLVSTRRLACGGRPGEETLSSLWPRKRGESFEKEDPFCLQEGCGDPPPGTMPRREQLHLKERLPWQSLVGGVLP